MTHVDVIKNEWLAGYQYVVARVHVEAGAVAVESPDPPMWEHIILRPIPDRVSGELIYAEKTPEEFVAALPSAIHGSYLFATEMHDDRACPFHSFVVPIGVETRR